MIAVNTLLQALLQAEVTEVCLTSDQRPVVRRGQGLEQLEGDAATSDDLLQVLFSTGGSRYVDSLAARPAQWRTRVEGVGVVMVSASMTGDVIEVRFTLKDAPAAAAPRTKSPRSSRRPPVLRSPKPPARARTQPDEAPPTPRSDDEGDRPSRIPTPPRGFRVPREAMRSLLELDLDTELPPLPELDSSDFDSVPPSADAMFPGAPPGPPGPPRAAPPPLPPPRAPTPAIPPRALTPPFMPRSITPVTMGDAPKPPVPAPRAPLPTAPSITVPPPRASEPGPERPPRQQTLPEASLQSLPPPSPSTEPKARITGRTTQPFTRDPHTPLLRRLLREARDAHASDLHLAAGRPPLLRVVGQVIPRGDPVDVAVIEDMWISRLPKRLEATFERDGSCDFAMDDPELGRFRVNVCRYRGGVKASLRMVPTYIPTLEYLGLPPVIAQATRHHQGLIVLTGPTGHGKTTTLAAVVDILNTDTTRHVITVEDPIEFIHPRKRALMSQREVGTHTRSFHTALKAALREDPDVIVIGELRDTETVRIALEASETGHLVLGTMSTPSAARAIDRLIDLFPPGDQQQVRMTLAGGLRLIVSQRLLPDVEGKAMVAAAEVLPGVVQLWNMIRDNRTYQIPSLQQRGRELGVVRLDDSLRELVRAGKTTVASAVAVAEAPDELEASLGVPKPPPQAFGAPAPPGSSPGQVPNGRSTSRERPDPKPPESRGIFDRVFKKGG